LTFFLETNLKQSSQYFQVFICYANEDRYVAEKLYNDLKKEGITPWLNNKDLLPGQNWKTEIKNAVKNSSHCIVLLSDHSVKKNGFIQKEVKIVLDFAEEFPPDKIFIIPARIDDCKPVHERLSDLQYVDFFESHSAYKEGVEKIIRAVNKDKNIEPEFEDQSRSEKKFSIFLIIIIIILLFPIIVNENKTKNLDNKKMKADHPKIEFSVRTDSNTDYYNPDFKKYFNDMAMSLMSEFTDRENTRKLLTEYVDYVRIIENQPDALRLICDTISAADSLIIKYKMNQMSYQDVQLGEFIMEIKIQYKIR